MSTAICASNVLKHALAKLASVELNGDATLREVWEQNKESALNNHIEDNAAAEFARKKFWELNLEPFCRDSEGDTRCPCKTTNFHSELTFSGLVSHQDPTWFGRSLISESDLKKSFEESIAWTQDVLLRKFKNYAEEIYQGYTVVADALQKTYDPQSKVVFLERFVPWRDHIYDVEKLYKGERQVNWVVFQDDRSLQWRITSVSDETNRFSNRALLHLDLRGLSGKDIAEKLGNADEKDCNQYFAHHSGFTGGAPTKEGVLALLKYSPE